MASALTQMLKNSQTSLSLMSAQIQFLEAKLSLVQIPREELQDFLPSIFQLLFPDTGSSISSDQSLHPDNSPGEETWANQHAFFNLTINPLECSIICSTKLAKLYFSGTTPTTTGSFPPTGTANPHAIISLEDFIVISVEGEGLNASQRVLELTTPLALAGVSIFFITTYFSDYILVPSKSRPQVISALSDRGFTFDAQRESYVNPAHHSHHHHRRNSSTSSFDRKSPTTPPPKSLTELQSRTFRHLRSNGIAPQVDPALHLIRCAGRRDDPSSLAKDELRLQHGLTKSLIHGPQFLSLTLTKDEPASLFLEKRQLPHFGPQDALLGNKDELVAPITLDLGKLPFDATGIVCGLAQSMSGVATEGGERLGAIEMSYLSTARAGTIIVEENDLPKALEALKAAEALVQ